MKTNKEEASADSTVIIIGSSDDEEFSDYEENFIELIDGVTTEREHGAKTPMNQNSQRSEEPTVNSKENDPNKINESKRAVTMPIRFVQAIPMELNDYMMDLMPKDESHTDEVNEEKQYRCEVCASRFTRKNTLVTHLNAVHNINY